MSLLVSEVFGPTVQGEGPSCGRRAVFIRLGLCNLDCGAGDGATWACDTPYTWDWSGKIGPKQDRGKLDRMDPEHVAGAAFVAASGPVPLIVITGGEPLVQPNGLADLVDALRRRGFDEIEVETNGTKIPGWSVDSEVRWNVSPKLSNSGIAEHRRLVPAALDHFASHPGAIFKFVCSTRPSDLAEVDEIVDSHEIDPRSVWIMPAGREAGVIEERAGVLVDAAVARGYNLTTRLHVLLWGDERGR